LTSLGRLLPAITSIVEVGSRLLLRENPEARRHRTVSLMRRNCCPILRRCGFALLGLRAHVMIRSMETLTEIAAVITRHASKDGFHATPIERVTLARSSTVTMPMPMPNVYRPQLCLVAQGHKEVTPGGRVFRYAPGRYGS